MRMIRSNNRCDGHPLTHPLCNPHLQSSLEKAKSWVKELQRQANSNIVIAFVGNKIDLVQGAPDATPAASGASSGSDDDDESEADDATATPEDAANETSSGGASKRQVSKEEAEAYAKEAGLLFAETSAKSGEGVVEVFTEIGESILTCLQAICDDLVLILCNLW